MIAKSIFGLSLAVVCAVTIVAGLSVQVPFVAADDGETELKAILVDGDGNEVGEAKFEIEDDESELKVELEGAPADTVFDISIASTSVGLVATNGDGEGETKWEPSPLVVAEGNEITVDDGVGNVLTGTFELEAEDDDEEEDEEDEDE